MPVKKTIPTILLSSLLLFLLILFLSAPALAQQPDTPPLKGPDSIPTPPAASPTPPFELARTLLPKIEPQLLKRLLQADTQSAPFIVYLKTQTDAAAVAANVTAVNPLAAANPIIKRTAIIEALQQTARNTQGGVLQTLNAPSGLTGQSATNITSLWIINAVAATGSLDMVLALAARPDVQVIRLDKEIKLSQPSPILDLRFTIYDCPSPNCSQTQNSKLKTQNSPEWGVTKIRADLVHNALGITGAGVVVANIDSGVDWQHPALQSNYRGYTGQGKQPLHPGNWFDATTAGSTYPVDANGHGTHTMGTTVGTGGIGVAPGAKWIAVKAFDSSGNGQTSWLHNAFQWILAPNGNPALAPDIVNNSWSSNNGFSTEFEADVQALLNAGIYPVFSAGNSGPGSGTVGSPASLNNAFAVGATTIDDEIANFSSRGPSPWGKTKPEISAPGKDVRSSLPGGAYGNLSGTSMAAPHVSGLAALLLQASPSLANNLAGISNLMMSTAVPLGSPIPNNNFGWGRIDAYNAVMSVAPAGILQGTVADATNGNPVNTPLIRAVPTLGGPTVNITGNAGSYTQGLQPNTYNVTASAFGYQPATVPLVQIITGATTIQNFSLTPQPAGFLTGTVKDKDTGVPLAATVTIDNTPVSANTNPADGSYSLELPVGVYTATVVAAQHRISKAVNINIGNAATTVQNFLLDDAPSILVVDSGKWYQESELGYYTQALTDALYPHDVWQISKPFDTPNDVPSAATLSNYDIVIWSAPFDSPGYIGADDEIEAYLDGGGKLLLSGQDVAYFDAFWFWQVSYLKDKLKANFVQDNSGSTTVTGVAGQPLAGVSVSITGGDGADNQIAPDIISNADADFAGSLLSYNTANSLAGLHIGLCVPYRAMYFAFGFEAINNPSDRATVMGQTVDWLMQSPNPYGVELTPAGETLVGDFGSTVSHTIRLRNTGSNADTFSLMLNTIGPYNWPTTSPASPVALTSCQAQTVTVDVQVPVAKNWHIADSFALTAQSAGNAAVTAVATRTTKTPAPVLLVDDDRWYSFADEFKAGLEANNIPYDYWLVPKSWLGPVPPSPPLTTLQMYPMTVWYTAYDWFDPLTPTEEDRLAAYLDGGGRLFFSSQDFLYRHLINHGDTYSPFAQNYLGILAHTEDYSSTSIIGRPRNFVGDYLGPYALNFPAGYNNWTDALTPTATAQMATHGQENQPNSLINAGVGPGNETWHTNFLAYGPELMDAGHRARLLQRSLGWLSWLGASTVAPNAAAVTDGSTITYTATLTNNGLENIATAYFTATFPAELTLSTYSADLTPAGGNLIWSGSLNKNQSKVFTYTANVAGGLPLGTVISQTSWLGYPDHAITFDRIATVNVNFPDLSQSVMSVTPNQDVEETNVLTYTIILENSGVVDAPAVTTTNSLPQALNLIGVDSPASGHVTSSGNNFTWTTALAQGQVATLTFRAVVSGAQGGVINNIAYAADGFGPPVPLPAPAAMKPSPIYLPLIFKN